MIETTARVPTGEAAEYMRKLCSNMASGIAPDCGQGQGIIHFDNAVATLSPSEDQLIVTILANDEETVAQLQSIISNELDRCSSGKTSLHFNWSLAPSLPLESIRGSGCFLSKD